MGSRISEKPKRFFEVFLEIGKPGGSNEDPFVIHKYPEDYDDKETLAMVPKFAYPCETDASNVDHFTFVLTDIDSMFRFGYCRHATGHQTCLCILSCLPWCEVFFKMLDLLAEITNRSEQNKVDDFLQVTYAHDIPLPKIPVTIVANEDMFNFTSPDPNVLPSIPSSRNLTEYYNAVDPSNMMRIFVSMLQERRIYMTSKKLSRLTACIHAAEALLYPMHWQHLFIPVLPSHLIDYISAPMPYLIGVHSNLVEKLKINRVDVADAVVVDLDANTVITDYDDLESMPEEVASYLKKNLKIDVVRNSMLKDGDAISRAFLNALVRLIGGYRAGLKIKPGEPITFDPEMFVHSRSSQTMQNYLEGMLALQIFQQFIYGRLEILNRGGGFVDMFEQLATVYADKLTSQSSYKEWLKNVKKSGRKGKEVWNGLKVKAPKMRVKTAVNTVKVQSKKVVADIKTKISSTTDDEKRSSSFYATGGIVHSRPDKRTSRAVTEDRKSRPPRPPLPSNRKESTGGPKISSADSQDDSQLRLSFHDMSLMGDADIQAAMMRSASAEALPKFSQLQESSGSSSSLSSGSVDEVDSADIPFGNLQSSDDESLITEHQEENLAPTAPSPTTQQKPATISPDTGDKLILTRERSNAQPPGRPPVAPPRVRRNNNTGPKTGGSLPPPPKPQPHNSLIKLDDGNNRETTAVSSATVQDAPLIRLESSESEATEADPFDPLGKPKSGSKTQFQKSGNLDFIAADDEAEGEEVQMRKLERNQSSRGSLTRSQAFRRESQKGPVRTSHVNDAEGESDDDINEIVTSPKDRDAVVFDPLSSTSSMRPASGSETPKSSDSEVSRQRSRTSSDLMRYEWSLASLAPSPHIYLPLGVNRGVGLSPKQNSYEQPGLIRQSTLPAHPFPVTSSMQATRGVLRSQASVPSMPGMPPAASQNSPQAQMPNPLVPTKPASTPASQSNVSSANVNRSLSPSHSSVSYQLNLTSSSSLFSSSETKPGFSQASSSAFSTAGMSSGATSFAQKRYQPVQSPFFNNQGGSPIHAQRNTMGPSSFTPPSSTQTRSSYAPSSSSFAKNSSAPKQSDPFGDLVNLGFGTAEKKSPQQSRPEKITSKPPPRPPQPSWETFD